MAQMVKADGLSGRNSISDGRRNQNFGGRFDRVTTVSRSKGQRKREH